MAICFEKARHSHEETLFNWLAETHVREFWDNSEEHKEDILYFIDGRIRTSNYFGGQYTYWIGSLDGVPYCLIMTIKEEPLDEQPSIKKGYLSSTGTTYSMDYMIGNTEFVGQGLGSITLDAFIRFLQQEVDNSADTFFIDPDLANIRAKRVYEKAGFEFIGNFIMEGDGEFSGRISCFMVRKLKKPAI